MRLVVLCLAVAASSGCASAVRKNVPLEELINRSGGTSEPGGDADRLNEQAEASFAEATVDGVRQSIRRWLSAYDADARPPFLAEAATAWGWLADRLEGEKERREAARNAVLTAQLCDEEHPGEVRCRYALALAYGVQARERRSTGLDALPRMVELLEEVIAEDPDLDNAGAHRTMALIRLRAPGWPTGVGDVDLGLEHAEAAVERFPDFAPNQLALGEAWYALDEPDEARTAYTRAEELAEAALQQGDRAAERWLDQAREGLAER